MKKFLFVLLLMAGCEVQQPAIHVSTTHPPTHNWTSEKIKAELVGRQVCFENNVWSFEKEDFLTISDIRLFERIVNRRSGHRYYMKCRIETRKPNSENWIVGVLVFDYNADKIDRLYGEGLHIKKEIR